MVKILVQPQDILLEATSGTNLLKVLQTNGIKIKSPCGGKGSCKKCKVELLDGKMYRKVLSCQIKVKEDLIVRVKAPELFADRKSGLNGERLVPVDGSIQVKELLIPAAASGESLSGMDRLFEQLGKEKKVSLPLLLKVPDYVTSSASQLQIVWEKSRLLDVHQGKPVLYGVAVDIGTTTMVCHLINLDTGIVEAISSDSNPQEKHGADVVARIAYQGEDPSHRQELQDLVVGKINKMISQAADDAGISREQIYKAVLCGNTVMTHLFLGLDASQIAHAPYVPPVRSVHPFPARDVGLAICPEAKVHLVPNIAGYVGGDTTALILSLGLDRTKKTVLAVDLGTNGEIVLVHDKKILSCSTAAGPAFEGAKIEFGMRADDGAIERVKIGPGSYQLETINRKPACGMCGSGVIDAVAQFLQWGLIDHKGRIVKPENLPEKSSFLRDRVGVYGKLPALLVAAKDKGAEADIWLTQGDIRELQLGKAAILAGIQILLGRAGLTMDQVDQVVLAGTFGNYVAPQSALGISMLPDISIKKIKPVGNAAGWGAVLCLGSGKQRLRAERISRRAQYLELSVDAAFQKVFMEAIMF